MEVPLVTFQGNNTGGDVHHRGSYIDPGKALYNSVIEEFGSLSVLQRNSDSLEEHEILTSSGIHQRVYVQRSKSKRALVTYHDIGTNHTSFLGFFNHPEMRVISRYFTIYHICAPGHHEGAATENFDYPMQTTQDQLLLGEKQLQEPRKSADPGILACTVGQLTSRHASMVSGSVAYPTLDQLAQMITSIVAYFGIDYFIGFGMGAGSNVLARYALHNPDTVIGLFLLNPTATTHTYFQKYRCRWWDLPYLQQGFMTENLLEQLDSHWFGYGLAENEDIVQFYHALAKSLNPTNLAGYIHSFMERTPINLVRPVGPPMPGSESATNGVNGTSTLEPTVIEAEVCLVTGDRATDLSRLLAEMNGQMDPKRTQFLMVSLASAEQ
ncbi:NDRG4 protein (S33 family) [Fasciola hepatica]|uniref:NDRG4 protein (S33 family) n=1 Tax=Fasciola hepatica TaxID=6192 RepID=A0A4E0R451_FASHE|nr:NDRG4 protein (S33 family) [Fasciola hepatica]